MKSKPDLASGVTRVGIRWIALFALFSFSTLDRLCDSCGWASSCFRLLNKLTRASVTDNLNCSFLCHV
jgi:hypothetical protein